MGQQCLAEWLNVNCRLCSKSQICLNFTIWPFLSLFKTLNRLVSPLTVERHELQAVADVLAAVAPVSVLWKLTAADQQLLGVGNVTLSHNIRLIEWAPQNDVLGHPATRAFLTQAGTNSFNEVSCCTCLITEHGFIIAAFTHSPMNSSPLSELAKYPT